MPNYMIKMAVAATTLALLSGCVKTQDVTPEIDALQSQFQDLDNSVAYRHANEARWWTGFNDNQLNQLVRDGVAANRDLEAAGKRIQAAYQRLGYEQAQYLPQGSVDGVVTWEGLDGNSSESSFLGANTIWELDLFGRISYLVDAAQADVMSATEYRRQVYVEVVSAVVESYLNWQGNTERYRIVSGQIASLENSIQVLQARVEEGISSTLDLHRTQAQLNQQEALLPAVEAALYRNRATLATLLGVNPDRLELKPVNYGLAGNIHRPLELTTPEKAVAQRPDIHIAMQRLIGQNALSNAAVASLYPSISLSGNAGILSESSSSWLQGDAAWSMTPRLSWSLLSLPALNAKAKAERSLTEAAYVDYEQTIINAIAESQAALVDLLTSSEVVESSESRLDHASKALRQVQVMYEEGSVPYLEVLDARREALAAEGDASTSKTQMLVARVSAYRAFNGGWSQAAYFMETDSEQ